MVVRRVMSPFGRVVPPPPPPPPTTQLSDAELDTLFALMGDGTCVTAASLQAFLSAMQVPVEGSTINDLFDAAAPSGAMSADVAVALFEQLGDGAGLLLRRCDRLAEAAEVRYESARLEEELREKQQCVDDLEFEQHAAARRASRSFSTSAALAASEEEAAGDSRHHGGAGSAALQAAAKEQQDRLAGLEATALCSSDELTNLSEQHAAAQELVHRRQRDHKQAHEASTLLSRRLWEHNTSMIAIERAYLAAKERFDAACKLQRELSRDHDEAAQVAATTESLLTDAQAMEASLSAQTAALSERVAKVLNPELASLRRLVQELSAATTMPTRATRVRAAAQGDYQAATTEAAELRELAEAARSDADELQGRLEALRRGERSFAEWRRLEKRAEDARIVDHLHVAITGAAVAKAAQKAFRRPTQEGADSLVTGAASNRFTSNGYT